MPGRLRPKSQRGSAKSMYQWKSVAVSRLRLICSCAIGSPTKRLVAASMKMPKLVSDLSISSKQGTELPEHQRQYPRGYGKYRVKFDRKRKTEKLPLVEKSVASQTVITCKHRHNKERAKKLPRTIDAQIRARNEVCITISKPRSIVEMTATVSGVAPQSCH